MSEIIDNLNQLCRDFADHPDACLDWKSKAMLRGDFEEEGGVLVPQFAVWTKGSSETCRLYMTLSSLDENQAFKFLMSSATSDRPSGTPVDFFGDKIKSRKAISAAHDMISRVVETTPVPISSAEIAATLLPYCVGSRVSA